MPLFFVSFLRHFEPSHYLGHYFRIVINALVLGFKLGELNRRLKDKAFERQWF